MNLQDVITIGIVIHASFGGLALLAGSIAIISKKGGSIHKKAGKIFYYSMLFSGCSALVISLLPGHVNPFLFVIGLFSVYLILMGYRSLRYRKLQKQSELFWDKCIAMTMLFVGLGMMAFGVYLLAVENQGGYVLLVFAIIAMLNATGDLRGFKDIAHLKKKWLGMHIGKMTGGYIAALTAFIVVNDVFPPLVNWLLPTVPGALFIAYWIRKTRPKKKVTVQS